MSTATPKSRLSIWQAAFVIARRDFIAILFSRAFFFFLLGPLFPVIVGALAGGIGSSVKEEAVTPEVGIAMSIPDTAAMLEAHDILANQLGRALPRMVAVEEAGEPDFDAKTVLEQRRGNYAAIVTGTPDSPVLTGPGNQIERWRGRVALVAATAAGRSPSEFPTVETQSVATSAANEKSARVLTAQSAQMLLFLLTMLLAGMVLSNLVEEKGNKIIEILAAAIPMDAVFLGKLFAMLGVSFVGITVWGLVGGGIFLIGGSEMPSLPAPAVGWPMFFALGIVYFAMAYLLLGSLFLAIGSMAATVREVQTLSMPVTMLQLMVFFFASYAMAKPGSAMETAAVIFPLSSPFAMLARAAQQPDLGQHLVALGWQALAVALFVKAGATLFRKRVMKSGQGPKKAKRSLFAILHRRKPDAA